MTAAPRPELALTARRRLMQVFGKLALALSSVMFVLVAMKVALRLLHAKPKSTGSSALSCFFAPDVQLGWRGRENAAYQLTTDNFDAFVSHDADGLRRCGLSTSIQDDVNHPGEVIWCVGDSTTYGWEIKDGKTFVDLLNQTSSGDRIYRNLGVPGYSPQQEFLLLRQLLGNGHRPDRILVLDRFTVSRTRREIDGRDSGDQRAA